MSEISLKELLEAGVHFGHQKKKWNPKMKKYIFGDRQGIHIIDLQKTMVNFEKVYQYLKEAAASRKSILFVGTKKQAQEIIAEEAERCGASYVNRRWLGGTLTNFEIIKKSIHRLRDIIEKEEKGDFSGFSKKEVARIHKEKMKLEKGFWGMRDMDARPDIVLIIDPVKEKTALTEARKVGVFTIGVVDTNGNPELLDLCIPANDDALRAIKLLVSRLADAVFEGKEALSGEKKKKEKEADAGEKPDSAKEEVKVKVKEKEGRKRKTAKEGQ